MSEEPRFAPMPKEAGAVLDEWKVDKRSNEIGAVPKLLEMLEIAGSIFMLDALHCQTETVETIKWIASCRSRGTSIACWASVA